MGERGAAIRAAVAVIRANVLSVAELELHLDSVWKSGYQAGRKAISRDGARVKAAKVAHGVAALKRIREQSIVSAVAQSTYFPPEKDK